MLPCHRPRAARSSNLAVAIALCGLLPLAAAGCGEGDEGDVPLFDDHGDGDSLPPGADGKADGFTVPSSLGLDTRGTVYITFDDGPSPRLTPQILDTLKAHGVKATFFVTGVNIAGNEAIIRRAHEEGHTIGSHQWKHVVATQSQFRTWVLQEKTALQQVVGDIPLYFRFPFGASAAWKETILKELGYANGGIGWHIDSLDWDFGPDEVSARAEVPAAYKRDFEGWVLKQVDARKGGVMLFHDVQSISARHLDSLLTKLKARGLKFGQLPYGAGTMTPSTPTTPTGPVMSASTFIGDPCSADAECAFEGGFCLTEDADAPLSDGTPRFKAGYCTQACQATCPDSPGHATTRCIRSPQADGSTMDLCLASCSAAGACRDGYSCQNLASPLGRVRPVCY